MSMRHVVIALLVAAALGCGDDHPLTTPSGAAGSSAAGTSGSPGIAGAAAGSGAGGVAGAGGGSGAGGSSGAGGVAGEGGGSGAGTAGTGLAGTGVAGTSAVAGASGTSGGAGSPGGPVVSPGCGLPLPASEVQTVPGKPTGYTHFTVMATGATLQGSNPAKAGPRTFWVRVPVDYDPNHPYHVVYVGQGCGGFNVANTSTYPLYSEAVGGSEQAVYVALDIPADMANQDCYDTGSGGASQEWEAFALIHGFVEAHFCVDNDHVYVGGYSTGGTLANMWGCYFAGDGAKPASDPSRPRLFAPRYHVRAQAAVASLEPQNDPTCNGPVAGFWIQDLMDPVPYAGAQAARDRVLRMNACTGSPTQPWHPEILGMGVCVQYTSCPAGYPVVFCTTTGFGHADQHERAVPGFKLFFDEVSAAR
jgi:hypothetical protein